MTTDDPFVTWDAGYVLGALSQSDRRTYEEHLAGCERCRDAVAELAGVPGLLALVPRETALSLVDDAPAPTAPPPTNLLPDLAAKTERARRRSRWITAGTAVAAAAAAVAIAVPVARIGMDRSGTDVPPATAVAEPFASRSMTNTVPSALSADFTLTATADGGTRVDLECRYDAGASAYPANYVMFVTDAHGVQSRLAEWNANPGDVVRPSATVATAPAEIRSVDIRSSATDQVVMQGNI